VTRRGSFDVVATREALATVLGALPGLTVYRRFPGTPMSFPCLIVWPPSRIDYTKASRGALDIAEWDLTLLAGRQSADAQDVLERYLSGVGEHSIIEALYADRTLGGVVSALHVTEAVTGLYAVSVGQNNEILGFDLTVEVAA
jgi:hypothetical protein